MKTTYSTDEMILAIERRMARIERNRERMRDRTLPYRTPEARTLSNQKWMSKNRTYELERSRLKRAWYKGTLTREEYLAAKAEAYARAHQIASG